MHEFTTGSAKLSVGRISRALHASAAAGALQTTRLTERLNAFVAQHEKRAGRARDSEEIVELIETIAQNEGLEFACQLLDLAAKFRDYDIVGYEIYREMAATPSGG
jgi:hypothetical protein